MSNGGDGGRPLWVPVGWFVPVALAIQGFHATGELHGEFVLQHAGVSNLPASELGFYAWYTLYGLIAVACATLAFRATRVPDRVATLVLDTRRHWLWVGVLSGIVVLAAVGFRALILRGEPVTDDELTYRFIAQTLAAGRIVNVPPLPIEFLHNQFVIATETAWYGKYPIGHPLFLAIGELAGVRGLIVPLVTAASMAVTFSIGRMLFSTTVALVGVILMAMSPQLVWTAGTELSQPTEMLCLLVGAWSILKIDSDPKLHWAVLGGVALGLAVLVRPMPGALCVIAAGIAFLDVLRRTEQARRGRRLVHMAVAVVLLVGIASLVFAVNAAQTGDAATSGYQVAHGGLLPTISANVVASSVGGALIRQSFWLFGVPLSLLFVPLARPRRGRLLFWGLLIAIYAYRVIVPKTVVSTTGPIYVFEAVPLLCLATAAGLARLKTVLDRFEVGRPAATIVAGAMAAGLAATTMFSPVQLASMHSGANTRAQLGDTIETFAPTGEVVVFVNVLVAPPLLRTWAYFPPNPTPDLSDRVLYLRLPRAADGATGLDRALELWQREMPDRRAYAFVFNPRDEEPFRLIELYPPTR